MDINSLSDHQAQLLMEMRLVFKPEDWAELDKLTVTEMTEFQKIFHMETLMLQARNRYVRENGSQPNQGYDPDLENSIVF